MYGLVQFVSVAEHTFLHVHFNKSKAGSKVSHRFVDGNIGDFLAQDAFVLQGREVLYIALLVEQVDVTIAVNDEQLASLFAICNVSDIDITELVQMVVSANFAIFCIDSV